MRFSHGCRTSLWNGCAVVQSLSLVMIVRNEEATLSRCLESVARLVDEIVVLDTGSTDGTIEVARRFGARIGEYTWNDHFAEARNAALELSRTDWNLVLDGDEYITNDCHEAIREFMRQGSVIGRIRRLSSVRNTDGIQWVSDYISRLFPSGIRYRGRIHEQPDSNLPRRIVDVEVGHDGYLDKAKSGRNIPLLEQELLEDPGNAYYSFQLAKEYRGIERYDEYYRFCKQAYKNVSRQERYAPYVIVEFLYAMLKSGKLEKGPEVIEREGDYLRDFPDFQFASALLYLEYIMEDVGRRYQLLPKIEQAYLRCLEIGETTRYDSVIGTGSFSAMYNLGVFYEVQGKIEQAAEWYRRAAEYSYEPALKRLQNLSR